MGVRYYLSLSELAYSEIYSIVIAKRDSAVKRISECDRLLEMWKGEDERRIDRFLITKAKAEIAKTKYESIIRELAKDLEISDDDR